MENEIKNVSLLEICVIPWNGVSIEQFIEMVQTVKKVYDKAYDGLEKSYHISILNTWSQGEHFAILCDVKPKNKAEIESFYKRKETTATLFDMERAVKLRE
jgi:hypothetical protein